MSNARINSELTVNDVDDLKESLGHFFSSLKKATKRFTFRHQLTGLLMMSTIPGWKSDENIDNYLLTEKHFNKMPLLQNIQNEMSDSDKWRVICEFVIKKELSLFKNRSKLDANELFYKPGYRRTFLQILNLGLIKWRNGELHTPIGGYAHYPSNNTSGLQNIFRPSFGETPFSALCLAIKLIGPSELDISDLWLFQSFDLSDNRVGNMIEIAQPDCLRLRNCSLGHDLIFDRNFPQKVSQLCQSIANGHVVKLDLSWCLLAEESGQIFNALKKTSIRKLDISFNFLDMAKAEDWNNLSELISNNKITHLNLAGNFFKKIFENSDLFNAFLEVVKNPSLHFLDLSQNGLHKLDKDNLVKLIDAIRHSGIKRLVLDNAIPEINGYNINCHRVYVNQSFGHTSIAYGVNDAAGAVYTLLNNNFSMEVRKRIYLTLEEKFSLSERAACSLWRQDGADLTLNNGSYFFKSNLTNETLIEANCGELLKELKSTVF